MAGVQDFVGKWREESKEGYDEMADALGIYKCSKIKYNYKNMFGFVKMFVSIFFFQLQRLIARHLYSG